MAQKVQVILVDDMDGGSADETVSFSLDGVSYEIDLSTRMPRHSATRWPSTWAPRARSAAAREAGHRPAGVPAATTAPPRSGNGPAATATR